MSTRGFILLGGDDRASLLQGILTQDVTKLAEEKLQFAALLSPQGKLINDMFLHDLGDAILIDTAREQVELLLKRLRLYKLRAKVTLEDVTDRWSLALGEGGLPDPRHPALPARHYRPEPATASDDDSAARLALGIPALGPELAPDTTTAMDAGYDLLHAISFTKGCYVGQEVTARMHYKSIARKGFFLVETPAPIAEGAALTINEKPVATLTGAQGNRAIALLKFEDALTGTAMVDNQPATLHAPEWMAPKLALFETAAKKQ